MTAKKAAPAAKAAPAKKAAPAAKASRAAKAAPPAPDRGAILAPRAKKAPSFRPAAEQTLEDDWTPPAPEPVREDPHARIRSLLRAAALEVEGKAPAAAPPPPPPPDEEVTRVLVAPVPPEADEWLAEDELEEEEDLHEEEVAAEPVEDDWEDDDLPEDDEDDWSAPEILEAREDEDEMLTVASAPSPRLSAPPRASRGATLSSPTPPPSPPTTEFTPPPFEAKPAPERKSGRSRLRIVVLVLAGLVAVAALFAAALWAYDNFRDEGIDYSELKVGDCFDSTASNEIRGIEVKPCAEPHNSEIFFIVTHPAGPSDAYPGKDALVQYAADNCLGQPLTDYLGIPLEQSKLKDFEIVPQESAWKDGRRVLVCGLDTGGEGDITGSVKGTRR
ncbi:MAG TPA: septum formation family protein [Acidimicrobiales bacterium]|nr:septum formation family protein [Acidimicrobiales bacterium]